VVVAVLAMARRRSPLTHYGLGVGVGVGVVGVAEAEAGDMQVHIMHCRFCFCRESSWNRTRTKDQGAGMASYPGAKRGGGLKPAC
jgi:hypothetical protein